MPNGTIKDLGAWAEDDFSGQCAKEGVTRNKAHQDRHGWDYLVEFPSRGMPHVPADRWPADVSARVQVKSKEKGKPFVDLKLSNAQRFAKEPGACFLILYVAIDGGEPVRIYARHFWKDEIALVLKRVREAHDVGRDDLHKLKVRLNFTAGDEHTEDLVAWMAGTVVGRPRYLDEKQTLIHTVGFEAGSGGFHGSLSFAADDLAALVDHQIGVRDIAPPLTITMTERRFGIDAKVPILSGTPDAAHLRSHPVPCRLRVRPPEGADLWLDGELFQPAFTDLPPDLWKVRVVADFIELIINGKGRGLPHSSGTSPTSATSPLFQSAIAVALDAADPEGDDRGAQRLMGELGWAAPGHHAAAESALLEILVSALRAIGTQSEVHRSVPGRQAALVARFRERVEARFRLREPVAAHAQALGTS